MKEQLLLLEAHDQPDMLVRVIQTIHRRGGHVRDIKIVPADSWAEVRIILEDVDNPQQVARSLEKLIDVRSAHFVTT
jgi:acetolactate synthase regulatory subunit